MKRFLIVLTLIFVGGCSIFGGTRTNLTITASEPDAQIFVNGAYQGNGTISTVVRRDETAAILVKKDGFHPAQRHIPTKLSGLGTLDAIGTFFFLIPVIGLAFPGAWTLDQTNITVLMNAQ